MSKSGGLLIGGAGAAPAPTALERASLLPWCLEGEQERLAVRFRARVRWSSEAGGSAAGVAAFCSGQLSKHLLDAAGIQPLAQFAKDHQGSFQALAG